jgi:two-component system, LuxR family, response regulator FixJ
MDRATVFVVDDEIEIRRSLRFLLNSAGYRVEEFASAESFIEHVPTHKAGVVLLDVNMVGMSGLELQNNLLLNAPCRPIIFMSGAANVSNVVLAMRMGAIDFLEKPFDDELLLSRIQLAMQRDLEAREWFEQRVAVQKLVELLSAREKQVMQLLVRGRSTKQIANELEISPKTAEAHRAHVMTKMRVESVLELVRLFPKSTDLDLDSNFQ